MWMLPLYLQANQKSDDDDDDDDDVYIENFKNLLVRKYGTNFNMIWQKCSLGDSLPRVFKPS